VVPECARDAEAVARVKPLRPTAAGAPPKRRRKIDLAYSEQVLCMPPPIPNVRLRPRSLFLAARTFAEPRRAGFRGISPHPLADHHVRFKPVDISFGRRESFADRTTVLNCLFRKRMGSSKN
jgi:hypothetical protein